MRIFKKLKAKLNYLSDQDVDFIKKAYILAEEAHKPQKRHSGEPYITHPVEVAEILAQLKMDKETIAGAILHDVIEDTPVSKERIVEEFGEVVGELVDGVSKLTQIEFVSKSEAQAENFRKMVLAMSRDIRVIIIKLADRLHNMRTINSLRPEKQRLKAKETLEIFAPIAKRLGMREISVEMEELSFQAMHPMRYRVLGDAVAKARGNRKKILGMIKKTLAQGMTERKVNHVDITGREKHLYSIYRKMGNKNIPFSEIMDVYAFRILVADEDTCYRALGVVHNLFKPVPERFKDYIAIAKANGYQSIHTTLFGPYGLPIEIQIRTVDMDRLANSGIASHWLYKSKGGESVDPRFLAQKWVRSLLELQQSSYDSVDFIENVKVDLFPDEVYVFTPKGRIMELPAGATAVDFAYAVHTDIGNACVAVKINRRLNPLSTQLANGQVIEIITANGARPNPAWLDFVATSKAKTNIRHFLKNQRQAESINIGKDLLKKSLIQFNFAYKKIAQKTKDTYAKQLKLNDFDHLLMEIGLGNRVAMLEAQHLANFIKEQGQQIEEPAHDSTKEQTPHLLIKGTEGMALNFANCCMPIPGDPIVGVIAVGKGITVHHAECVKIKKMLANTENCVALRWANNAQGMFKSQVKITLKDTRGAMAMVTQGIAEADCDIEDVMVMERDGTQNMVLFTVLVKSRLHLAEMMRYLRQLPVVQKINRA